MSASDSICPYPICSVINQGSDDMLAAALLQSVEQYFKPLTGKKVWLACSGGRDSLALAAICAQLYHQNRLPFLPHLLHVNHHLQSASDAWATHVQDWAAVQNLPCQVLSVTVNGKDEQAARQARYSAMSAAICQDDVIMLAHHSDDQAETLLFRLISGAGVAGLSAMKPWREVNNRGDCYHLFRPWLGVRRDTISHFAKASKLPYIDDPTNLLGDNARSHLRQKILPELAVLNPKAITNIAKSAALLGDVKVSLESQIAQNYQHCQLSALDFAPIQRVLDSDKLRQLPPSQRGQLLHFWLGLDEPLPPPKRLIDEVLALALRADNNHESKLEWQAMTQNFYIFRYRHQLFRLNQDFLAAIQQPIAPKFFYPKSSNQETITLFDINNYQWQLELSKEGQDYLQNQGFGLDVRALNRDQKLTLAPNATPKSGKKLFQALGIPVWLRNTLIVVSLIDVNQMLIPVMLCSLYQRWSLYELEKVEKIAFSTMLSVRFSQHQADN